MFVRVLFGRYAGEVRDIEPVSAKTMLEDGRAEDPRFDYLKQPKPAETVALPKPTKKVKP